jgi:hypothetical protein
VKNAVQNPSILHENFMCFMRILSLVGVLKAKAFASVFRGKDCGGADRPVI